MCASRTPVAAGIEVLGVGGGGQVCLDVDVGVATASFVLLAAAYLGTQGLKRHVKEWIVSCVIMHHCCLCLWS